MVTNNSSNIPTAASGKVLQGQGVGVSCDFSTATYPATTTANSVLYSSATNTVSEITPTANRLFVTTSGSVPQWGTTLTGDFTFTSSGSGVNRNLTVSSTDNTSASTAATVTITVGGGTAGDPKCTATVTGAQSWSWGIDNSDSDAFVIAASTALGTTNVFRSSTTGQCTFFSSSTDTLTLNCSDAGAAAGPIVDLYRSSASPAAADVLGSIPFNGVDSGAAKQEYARIESRIVATTAGAENGALALYTTSAGTSTKQVDLLNTGGQYRGNNTNTAPPAGYIGESISSTVVISTVAMTSATPANITSISLTAGIWDVSGGVMYSNASGLGNSAWVSINTTSATLGTTGDNSFQTSGVTANQSGSGFVSQYRIVLSSTTTVYLVGQITITSGTITAGGRISATRVG